MNYKKRIFCFLVLIIFILNGCQTSTRQSSGTVNANQVIGSTNLEYDDNDIYQEYTESEVTKIDLNNQTGDIQITSGGTYLLNGTLTDGSIQINVSKSDTVRLILNNVSITNNNGPAIACMEAKKLIISLEQGSVNVVSDGNNYQDISTDSPTAAIYAKDDMTINGSGTLSVTGNYNDAIASKDTLKLMEGNYEIVSVDDGIVGRDFLYIYDGSYNITVEGDGLKTTYDIDTSKGNMIIEGGVFNIISGNDGIQSENELNINDGIFTIKSGGGSTNSSTSANANMPGGFGVWNNQTNTEDTPSAKGIKARINILILGGTYQMDTSDDAIHSNNTLTINGGNYSVSSGDDGFHSDINLNINGGDINIIKSYEGFESCIITINSGKIQITSSDDGINSTADDGQVTTPSINIHGGSIQIDSGTDGIDSNSNITMYGGEVVIFAAANGGESALDYDGIFNISGGTLIAVGYSQMAQSTSNSSSQHSLLINLSSIQQAGTPLYISRSDEELIVGVSPDKTYSSVLISTPQLQKGDTYDIYTGGTGGTLNDSGYIISGISGGSLVKSVTIESITTTVGNISGMGGIGGGKR